MAHQHANLARVRYVDAQLGRMIDAVETTNSAATHPELAAKRSALFNDHQRRGKTR